MIPVTDIATADNKFTLTKGNGDNQGKKSTNGMSVRWITHINEFSWKYRESHEWFRFGGSL